MYPLSAGLSMEAKGSPKILFSGQLVERRFSQRMFSVELIKKIQERSGHLVWRLLLNPVAFTVNNGGASEVCAVRSCPSVEVNARYKRPHWIERPSNEGTGLMDLKP